MIESTEEHDIELDRLIIAAIKKIDFYRWYTADEAWEILDPFWANSILETKPSLFRKGNEYEEKILGAYIVGHVMNLEEIDDREVAPLELMLTPTLIGRTQSEFFELYKGLTTETITPKGREDILYPSALVIVDKRYALDLPIVGVTEAEKKEREIQKAIVRYKPQRQKGQAPEFIERVYEHFIYNGLRKLRGLVELFLVPLSLVIEHGFNIDFLDSGEIFKEGDKRRERIVEAFRIGHLDRFVISAYGSGRDMVQKNVMTREGKRSIVKKHIWETYTRYRNTLDSSAYRDPKNENYKNLAESIHKMG